MAATLDFIRAHGFPKLAALMPQLPPQLARVPGVETDTSGLPTVPDDFGGATFGDSAAALNAVLADAKQLSAQGFSESRRLEAMVLNLAGPLYDVLGRGDLFAQDGTDGSTQVGSGFALQGGGLGSSLNIFDHLASALQFAVNTGGEAGMPSYLVVGAHAGSASIDISGLWPYAGEGAGSVAEFATGFHARVRLHALDDLDISLTLSPSLIAGLVPGWKAESCADDLWRVSLKAQPDGGRTLDVASHECPSARDAVSTVQLASAGDGWRLTGGFAQSFPDAKADSLRGWLGTRQGFVVQAATTGELDKLAAAAAVLGESDFAAPSQQAVDQFGVGQLIARYFQATYFDPRRDAAAKGSIFTDPGLRNNIAYWTCEAVGVSSAVQNATAAAKDLCAGKTLDVESILATLVSLNTAIKDVGLVPGSVRTTVARLVDILTIRNTLFVGGEGALAFKTAPDDTFQGLDEARKGELPTTLGATTWKADAVALLPRLTESQVPNSPFKALSGGLSRFLEGECETLAGDAATKAGKAADAAKALCGG